MADDSIEQTFSCIDHAFMLDLTRRLLRREDCCPLQPPLCLRAIQWLNQRCINLSIWIELQNHPQKHC